MYLSLGFSKNINSKKRRNVCLLSGENKSVRKFLLMSRFRINSLCIKNNLQNLFKSMDPASKEEVSYDKLRAFLRTRWYYLKDRNLLRF